MMAQEISLKNVNEKTLFPAGKMVLVGGCFDVLHVGHIEFLTQARCQGDFLVVALESDEFIKIVKKKTPFHNQKERSRVLRELRCVDWVVLLPRLKTDKHYLALVRRLKPKVIAITRGDPQKGNKEAHIKTVGGILTVVTPHIAGKSTTNVIKAHKNHTQKRV